jgi:hypothetical protein
MNRFRIFLPMLPALVLALISPIRNIQAAEASTTKSGSVADTYFAEEVWTKVGAQSCLKCHKAGGDAEDSKFVLQDPARDETPGKHVSLIQNRAAFIKMAEIKEPKEGNQPRMLLKATGGLKHEGEEVLKPDSTGYRILVEFVRRANLPQDAKARSALLPADKNAPPFFEGIAMLDDKRLLRRVTLQLAGRLPTSEEYAAISKQGTKALPVILDAIMKEDAFYDRLREGFNDIFLTLGADGNADQTFLSYDHFPQRHWYQKWEFKDIPEEKDRKQAGYKMAADYRKALHGEPLKLIEHIVRNEKPFTEIVTADYIMVTPYGARGYGLFEDVKGQFKNADDPLEYIPVKLKALVGRSKEQNQESATGFYPHAGLLSTFQYLCRYPTTETNRNRLRARMYYQHFLGVDVLELAARVSDAAAVTAKYKVPTMEASECVVCHKTLDPVAGMFQDFWRFADQGVYGKRKEGWFTDMFNAGYEGEDLPPSERWRSLQWLGERTAKDPRFAVAMVEHAYYILTGRKVLLPPKDLEDALYSAKHRSWQTQRKQVEDIAARFARNGFNFKSVIKDWIATEFYRADGLATSASTPARRAELADIGIARMLSPEQLERKLAAVFGKGWGRLHHSDGGLDMLYGGIDSKEVTERAADPSGAMGAIQRIMANDMACKYVALDFSKASGERRLFPGIEPDVIPDGSADAEKRIRAAIVYLHDLILGRNDAPDEPEVTRTYKLFEGIISDAHARKGFEPVDIYACRGVDDKRINDPQYTVRAWRAVVTYLLRQQSFLYE